MDKIFELIKDKLNENSFGVEFKGNVYLQAKTQSEFVMFKEGTSNTLELQKVEYVPIGLNINEPTKYLGSNKRIQWQKSLYFPIKSDNHINFDYENPRLKAIEETIPKLHGKVFDYEDVRIGMKVDDVKREQTLIINGSVYVMAVLRIYAEQVTSGFFGQEIEFQIKEINGDYQDLDVIEVDIGFGAEYDSANKVNTSDPTYGVIKNGGVIWNIDFYLHDSVIERQITEDIISGNYTNEYIAKVTFPAFNITIEKRVAITQAGKANKKLSIMAINMRLQEVL